MTNNILDRIGATQPRWYVFNQIDRCTSAEIKKLKTIYKHLKPIFVSAKTGDSLEELVQRLQFTGK